MDQSAAPAHRSLVLSVLLGLAAALLGCGRGAKTPDEAFSRFAAAVKARDAEALYSALDLETRWSWMSIRRAQRESYDIILSNFPEGPQQEAHVRRFEAGALAEDEAKLFAATMNDARWAELARGLPGAAAGVSSEGDRAEVPTSDGRKLAFRRHPKGGWGFAGYAGEAEEVKRRALADLELVRTNAADFERASTRAGK